jgi:hypothetical protein
MSKRPSALRASIAEAQEEKNTASKKGLAEPASGTTHLSPSPTSLSPFKTGSVKEKKENLRKVTCYLRPQQVDLWDDMTEELRLKMKKKRLPYKDIDRQVILREIFDTINHDQIEQLLTAKRSNS